MANIMQAGKWTYTKEELDKMHEEATRRGEEKRRTEPRALSAKYDEASNRLILELRNRTTFIVPCNLLQGLADAAPELIAEVELWSEGAALHWEKLDADFSVESLLRGTFGGKSWMAKLPERLAKITTGESAEDERQVA